MTEADPVDAAEQDPAPEDVPVGAPLEADPADAVEQALVVEDDEDERR